MKHESKSHQTRGSVLRPLLAALLLLGGVALLAQAGSPTKSGYTSDRLRAVDNLRRPRQRRRTFRAS